MLPEARDPYPEALSQVAQAMITGNRDAAEATINEIAFAPTTPFVRAMPSIPVAAEIYHRDRYQCRYCGQKTILTAVMRLISQLFPEQFPYHPNWKAGVTHPAVAARSPSLDHIEAIAHGGAALDPANFATACWPCNSKKGDLSLSALGWSLLNPADAHWYGLANLYPALWKAAGEPKLAAQDKQWLSSCRRLFDA